jgi:hypothetical protein
MARGAVAIELPSLGVTRLLIVASEGKWNFKASPANAAVRIEGADFDSQFIVNRREDRIEITDRREYLETAKTHQWKEYQVSLPAKMGLELHLNSGEVFGVGIKGEGSIDMQNGKVLWSNAQGSWSIHLHKGDLDLAGNEARLTVDQYSGHCAIKGLQGDLQLSEFLGDLLIDKSQGSMHLALGSGSAKIQNSGGSLILDSAKSSISVPQFSGPIEGSLQEGALNILLSDESDVRLKSQAAKISIGSNAQTGLSLNLFNTEGEIIVPNPLRVARDSNGKFFRGKWKSERETLARVQIRAQDGVITIH